MIQPVGALVQPVNPMQGMSQLSSILGLRQAQQNLQTGAIQQQNAAAITQQNQLAAQQQQGVQDFFQKWDPSQHFGDDGTTDLDSALQSDEFKAAGNAKPAIMKIMLDVKGKQLETKQQLANLNGTLLNQFTTQVGALAKDDDVVADKTDPDTGVNPGRAKVDAFIGNFAKQSPDAARIAQMYAPITQHVAPGRLSTVVQALQMQGQSASEQQAQQNPAQLAVGTGAATNIYNVNKSTGLQPGQQPAAAVPNALPPGTSIVYDANKNAFYLNTQTNTVTPVGTGRPGGAPSSATAPPPGPQPGAAPGAAAPGQSPPGTTAGVSRPANLPPGLGIPASPPFPTGAAPQPGASPGAAAQQPSTIGPNGFVRNVPGQDAIVADIANARSADADYGLNRHINDRILSLSAKTDTGPGSERWHDVLGAVAGPLGGNNVSDFQTVSAYLDRQAAMASKQMGLPDTNAGLETARGLSGSTSYQPAALQEKTKLTDALVEGAHQYRQGLDKIVGTGPVQDLSRYQQYRNAWAANFDPNVYLYDNARARGDKDGVTKLVANMSQSQAAELQQKRRNLAMLANGQIPQQ